MLCIGRGKSQERICGEKGAGEGDKGKDANRQCTPDRGRGLGGGGLRFADISEDNNNNSIFRCRASL